MVLGFERTSRRKEFLSQITYVKKNKNFIELNLVFYEIWEMKAVKFMGLAFCFGVSDGFLYQVVKELRTLVFSFR